MKKLIVSFILLVTATLVSSDKVSACTDVSTGDTLKVYAATELYEMACSWTLSYNSTNSVNIVVSEAGGEELRSGDLNSPATLYLTSVDPDGSYPGGGMSSAIIGRSIIVPVTSAKNPFLGELRESGLSQDRLRGLMTGGHPTWGGLIKTESPERIKFYSADRESTATILDSFLGTGNYSTGQVSVLKGEKLIPAILDDKYSIGFCTLEELLKSDRSGFIDGIEIIPIDVNENGTIDYFEEFYDSYSSLLRAVWIGKYPRALYSKIVISYPGYSLDKELQSFVQWVITTGQTDLMADGYSGILLNEVRQLNNNLYAQNRPVVVDAVQPIRATGALLIAIAILTLIVVGWVVRFIIRDRKPVREEVMSVRGRLDETKIIAPAGFYYDNSHTWAFMEKDGYVRVGIADFLQHVTGRVTRINMKNPGEKVRKGEALFTLIQDGKHLVINSPVSGTISRSNSELKENAQELNRSPYEKGWIYLVEPSNWLEEIRNFLMGDKYHMWINKEINRLREFILSALKSNGTGMQVAMQDGGELIDYLLENQGPDIWEDFQTYFLNKSK